MIPNQLTYRNILLQLISGFLLLSVIGLFIIDFVYDKRSISDVGSFFIRNELEYSRILVLFICLILSYIAGMYLNNSYETIFKISYDLGDPKPKRGHRLLYKIKRRIILAFTGLKENSRPQMVMTLQGKMQNKIYYEKLRKKVWEIWKIQFDNSISYKDCKVIFELCRSYVECKQISFSVRNNFEDGEIESQFISMHFNARLVVVYLFACIGSLFEFFNSIFGIFTTTTEAKWYVWAIFTTAFFYLMKNTLKKSLIRAKQWVRFIFYSFLNY